MIPLWMFPLAIACGNTFVLKPSEQDPLTPMKSPTCSTRPVSPRACCRCVHGDGKQVDLLLTHPDIKAISFVGSAPVGQHIYRTGTQHLKRVQCMAGAKNHMVIMPDADKDQVINALVGASVRRGRSALHGYLGGRLRRRCPRLDRRSQGSSGQGAPRRLGR